MYKNGHRGVALLLMAPLTATLGLVGLGMSLVAVVVCRLPDLDHDYDWLPHRGPTHTLWFALGVAALVAAGGYLGVSALPVDVPARPVAVLIAATVFLGLVSHLFADALTVGRGDHAIRPFSPLSTQPMRVGLVRANSRRANGFLLVGGILSQGLALGISAAGPFVISS